jgi:hypothetical protein
MKNLTLDKETQNNLGKSFRKRVKKAKLKRKILSFIKKILDRIL